MLPCSCCCPVAKANRIFAVAIIIYPLADKSCIVTSGVFKNGRHIINSILWCKIVDGSVMVGIQAGVNRNTARNAGGSSDRDNLKDSSKRDEGYGLDSLSSVYFALATSAARTSATLAPIG